MESLFILLILLVVASLVCGPIALIVGIVALSKIKQISIERAAGAPKLVLEKEPVRPPPMKVEAPPVQKAPPITIPIEIPKAPEPPKIAKEAVTIPVRPTVEKEKKIPAMKTGVLEQRIGTRWVLIAGVITTIVAVGFFLKYAYDNNLIGPMGRVVIATIAGLIALAVGEITRRRGYEIVAKGVTALGFAILYVAVFSAYRFYGLVGPAAAFVLSILVTAAAMLYAVSLNEIVVAFLSLLGGFLTPVIVSTGENRPIPLFSYLSILGVGTMLCGISRKWRAVNFLSFAGTFILYILWFEKFYRPAVKIAEGMPEQMPIALTWLGVFFVIYLVLPMLYELIKKVKAQNEDVLLILANAAIVFYYMWRILFDKYRTALAFCAIGLCVIHLAIMAIVNKRCKEDINLRLILLVIGLFFVTIAVPLYLKMYAIAMAWAVEGVILAVIGLRYRSIWTQIGGGAALLLSLGRLIEQLPMHTGAFQLVLNPAFGTWCFVATAILVCHIVYHKITSLEENLRSPVAEILYAIAFLTLTAAATMEWWWHCNYNISKVSNTLNFAIRQANFTEGMIVILAVCPLLFLIRPICPKGILTRIVAATLATVGSIYTLLRFSEVYWKDFTIFANEGFWTAMVFVGGLFVGAWLLKRDKEQTYNRDLAAVFELAGIFVLWVLLTEEIYLYWYWLNRLAPLPNWKFLAHMYISVMWAIYGAALMTLGFWRKSKDLRYVALGLFALLLVKVFVLDTSTVKSVYRIAAFAATGITLVGVSYLYQFLKKKGFFDAMLIDRSESK
jgi:uncharacterized membrane protein